VGKEIFVESPSLQIVSGKVEILEAHKMMHEIVFTGPKEIFFVYFIDEVVSFSCVLFCWFEWRGLGDSIGRSVNRLPVMLQMILQYMHHFFNASAQPSTTHLAPP
jgi:hypothetical protein